MAERAGKVVEVRGDGFHAFLGRLARASRPDVAGNATAAASARRQAAVEPDRGFATFALTPPARLSQRLSLGTRRGA